VDRDELFLHTLNELQRLHDLASDLMAPVDPMISPLLSPYNFYALQISAQLRKLLLDGGNSLVHIANRSRKLKIHFAPNSRRPDSRYLGPILDGFDPESAHPGNDNTTEGNSSNESGRATLFMDTMKVATTNIRVTAVQPMSIGLDEFLKRIVIVYQNNEFTVDYVIKHLANIEGGVHAGQAPKNDPRAEALAELIKASPTIALIDEDTKIPGAEVSLATRVMLPITRVVLRAGSPLKQQMERERKSV
jgi:hypothetical protein